RPMKAASRTSPRTRLTPPRIGSDKSSSQPWLSKELYCARAATSAPAETRASVKCEPMKPSAPVTRILVPTQLVAMMLASLSDFVRTKPRRDPRPRDDHPDCPKDPAEIGNKGPAREIGQVDLRFRREQNSPIEIYSGNIG